MEYDRVKNIIAIPMRKSRICRRLAFKAFHLGFLRVRHVRRQLKHILEQLPPGSMVLDAGFGFGPYSDQVLRGRSDVSLVGVEITQEQVDDSRKYFEGEGFGDRCSFRIQPLEELDETDTYNLAIAVDILEHIEDDVKVMTNIRKSLKPGGQLFIHTPASEKDSRLEDRHEQEFFVGEHVREGYAYRELREKLHEAGFKRVELRYTYGRWGMVSWWMMQGIPFRLLERSLFFAPLLLPYYLLVFPFAHRFMLADMTLDHLKGGGLMARAWK